MINRRHFERDCIEVDDPERVGNDGEGKAVLGYGRLDISLITGTRFERSLRQRTGIPGLVSREHYYAHL